jgi:hypothetical protein
MRVKMSTLSVLATFLTIVGAINWGLVGLLNFNLVRALSGPSRTVERVVYQVVGIAGLWLGISLTVPRLLATMGRKGEDVTVLPSKVSIVGQEFPELHGTTLEGRPIKVPHDLSGKVALLAVGFTYESRWDVEDWVDAFRHQFEERPGFTYYEIPVIGGLARLAAPAIEQGMRAGTPPSMWSHVLTVYGPSDVVRKKLGAAEKSDTWIYLLDSSGKVISQIGGAFDQEVYENLASKASAAEAASRPRMERRAA